MDDFEIKQVESDDPEKLKFLIKLPAEYCTPEFLKILWAMAIEEYLKAMDKEIERAILYGVKNDGRD
jgi:hypothetical protein